MAWLMRWLVLATLAAVALSLVFPRADLAASALFYNNGFYLEWHPLVRGIYLAVRYATVAYIALLLLWGLGKLCGVRRLPSWRSWRYLLLVLLVGPLLLIETVSKDYVHRPRPREVTEFGGALTYVPPLAIGAQPGKSFVSNHAATGFYIVAFAFLLTGRKRRVTYIGGLLLGTALGALRVIQGGHFASDIVFAGLIMLWTIHLLAWIILPKTNREKL